MEAISIDMGEDPPIHALRTKQGLMFSMSQIAVELFNENPGAFGKELRRGRYPRRRILDQVVLKRLAQLGIPPESINVVGATLLPPDSLLKILEDKRRGDLVPKVRTALLRMIINDVKGLIASGQFEDALPIAMDAVVKGQALYYPKAPLNLVPVYLLAVQVNLGMGRPVQSEDLLGVGSWLLLQDKSDQPKESIRSELSRLFGQLSMLQKNPGPSLKAFSEEIYYKSKEFGIYDVRTSVAFYNLSKVFQEKKQMDHAMAFWEIVVESWMMALKEVVLNTPTKKITAWGKLQHAGKHGQFMDTKLAIGKLIITEVCEMLQDICNSRAKVAGAKHMCVGEVCFVLGLAFMHCQKRILALEHLHNADSIFKEVKTTDMHDLVSNAVNLVMEHTPRMFPAPTLPHVGVAPPSPPSLASPASLASPTSSLSPSPPPPPELVSSPSSSSPPPSSNPAISPSPPSPQPADPKGKETAK